jgi:hypothetical protein
MSTHKCIVAVAGVIIILLPVVFVLSKILQPPLEPVPFDAGWLGFLFIFANGFFLSFILNRNRVGILERALLTLGLGFGLTFVVMILVGVLWDFYLPTIILTQTILLIVLGVAAYSRGLRIDANTFSWPKKSDFQLTRLNVFPAFILGIIGVLVFVALYDAVAFPVMDWDSLAYGVNYAKIMFQAGNIPLIAGPSIGIEMSAPYPPGVQLIAVFLYVFTGNANDFYYKLLSPIFSIATLIVTYKFAMHLNKNRAFSIYAISALSLIPFFWELFIRESYLMTLTFMLTTSAFFFYKAYQSNPTDAKKYEVIGVLFCAFASLTSYIGLFSLGIPLLYAVAKKSDIKRIGWLMALALVIVMPWYARNLVLLGNPIYPFLGIGRYLDPLLRSSTVQHFQHYALIPFYGWTTAICKVGTGLLVVGIGYFTFSKRKNFLIVLPLYFLFICTAIMGFHASYPRYLMVALPVLAVVFSAIIYSIPKSRRLSLAVSVVLLSVIVLTSAVMLPYLNTVKPQSQVGEDKWLYLSRVYEEGDAWQWINQNTPANTKIATFDIKQYYLNRAVFSLDGNESALLYNMNTIQEGIKFLQDNGVGYVLSVPWASPMDNRLPPAYTWCILTSYLGDPDYLPPVFVGRNGTAVYHVGPFGEATLNQTFVQKVMVTPMKHVSVNVVINNFTSPSMGECYLPIPVDYRTGTITASVNSSKPVDLEFWNGLILTDKIDPASENFMIAKSPYANATSIGPFSFQWHIDKAGYFTIRVIDKEETFQGTFNVTLNIAFYSSLDLEST